MKKKVFFILLFMYLNFGLFSEMWMTVEPKYENYLDSWIDINADRLIAVWGLADKEGFLSDGTKIFEYNKIVTKTNSGHYVSGNLKTDFYTDKKGNLHSYTTGNQGYYVPPEIHQYSAYVTFQIDNNNNIIGFSFEGQIGALNDFVNASRCPYFDLNKFYLTQYYEKAQEWIGYSLDELKKVYNNKQKLGRNGKKNLLYIEEISIPEKAYLCQKGDSEIIFVLDKQNFKIAKVYVKGNYKEINAIYCSPLDISFDELNFCIIPGFSYGTNYGINLGNTIDFFYGIKLSSDFDIFFNNELFNLVLMPVALDYYFIDEAKAKFYGGIGYEFGWNFGSSNHGFNHGARFFTGLQIKNFDIKASYKVGGNATNEFVTDWKIQLSYVLKPDFVALSSGIFKLRD